MATANHESEIITVDGLKASLQKLKTDHIDGKAPSSNFGASGTNHSAGLVPDPGATQGNTKFLREDGTWLTPDAQSYVFNTAYNASTNKAATMADIAIDYTDVTNNITSLDATLISTALRKTSLTLTAAEKLQARTNIDAEGKVDIVVASDTSLTAEVNKYYRYDTAVSTLAITLPVPTDNTHLSSIIFAFTTDSTTNVTFTSTATIKYKEEFEIKADTSYEINAIYNGSYWAVGLIKLETAV